MNFLDVIILAIVEGVTEFLPVSSTGHMIAASHLLNIPQSEFLKTFEIAIQLGAIAAVFSLYWRTFLFDWEIGLKVLAAFVPTAVIGFVVYKAAKAYLLGNVAVVAAALLLGGVLMVVFELLFQKRARPPEVDQLEKISWGHAVLIGTAQALAIVPGVSRSAATILAGLSLGMSRTTIVEFSFLLAVPTMLAATGLDLLKSHAAIGSQEWLFLAAGGAVAFVSALGTVKFLLRFVQRHNFIGFGVYRVLAGIWLLYWIGKQGGH